MDNSIKNKLKKIRNYLEKEQELNNIYEKKKEKISEKLWELNDIQSKLYEYNNYRRNSHIGIGIAVLIASFFVTKNILNQELINAILMSLGISSTSLLGTHGMLKHKINKLKKENPEIDFENSNYDENEKKRQNLLKKQMEYSKKISDINNMNKKCVYCLEELESRENINTLTACEILNKNKICDKEKTKEQKQIKSLIPKVDNTETKQDLKEINETINKICDKEKTKEQKQIKSLIPKVDNTETKQDLKEINETKRIIKELNGDEKTKQKVLVKTIE